MTEIKYIYALVLDGYVEQVVFLQNDLEYTKNLVFSNFSFDEAIDISTYPNQVYRGYRYNNSKFYPPRPYASWIFDDVRMEWQAPEPLPDNYRVYNWNEQTISWELCDVC